MLKKYTQSKEAQEGTAITSRQEKMRELIFSLLLK